MIDRWTMLFNSATVGVGWLALFLALHGKDQTFPAILRRRRLLLACILGAMSPLPPSFSPRTYVPSIAQVIMALGDTGHVSRGLIIRQGAVVCLAYGAAVYALLWATTRVLHARKGA